MIHPGKNMLLPISLILACGGAEEHSFDDSGDAPASPHRPCEQAFPGRTGPLRTIWLETPSGTTQVTYELIDGFAVVDGDILLFGPDDVEKGAARRRRSAYWPRGVVPFVIHGSLPDQRRVHQAIAHWQANTNVRFVERTTEAHYVRFVPGPFENACSSWVGRRGGGQDITLGMNCDTGNTIHEIGHAVGLWHEQSRADRDEHVVIHWGNIEPGRESNFQTYVQAGFDGRDLHDYDFSSIMHYDSFAFSHNRWPTITRLDGGLIHAQRLRLSAGDIATIQTMYSAGSRETADLPLFTLIDDRGGGTDDRSR